MLLKLSSAKEHELNEDELSILRAQRGLIQMLKKQPHRASDPRLASLLLDEARTLQTLERMVARADENDDDVIIQDSDDEMGLQLAPAAQASSAPAVVASDAPISKASASTAAATAVPAVAAPASSAASSSSDSSDSSDSDSSDSDDSSSDDSDESDSSEDSSSSSEDSDSSDDGPPRAASSKNPLPISVLEPRPLVNGGVIPGEGMKRTQARNRRRRTLDRARRNGQPPSPAVNGKTSTPAKKTGPYADYDEAAPSSAPAKRVTNGAVNGEAAAQRQRRQSAPAAPDAARPSPSTCNQHVVPPSERMHEVPSNLFVTVVDVEKRGWEPGMRTLVESAAPHQPNGTHTNDLVSPTVNGAAEITQWTPEEVDVEWHFLKSLDRAHAKLGMIVAQKVSVAGSCQYQAESDSFPAFAHRSLTLTQRRSRRRWRPSLASLSRSTTRRSRLRLTFRACQHLKRRPRRTPTRASCAHPSCALGKMSRCRIPPRARGRARSNF